MRYLKSFRSNLTESLNPINELVKNKKSVKWHLNKALSNLNSTLSEKITRDNIKVDIDRPNYYKIEFLHTVEVDHIKWMDWLSVLKYTLSKEDIIVSYKHYKKFEQRFIGDGLEMESTNKIIYDYIVYLKNIHTRRVKPNRFVYHYSSENNRGDILKNGLKAKSHKDSKDWKNEIYLEYPEAIFAVNCNDVWRQGDRWQIDTNKIKNTWWEDLNFIERQDLIMTFSNIPKEAISLKN